MWHTTDACDNCDTGVGGGGGLGFRVQGLGFRVGLLGSVVHGLLNPRHWRLSISKPSTIPNDSKLQKR